MNNQIINELRTSPLAMAKSGAVEMDAILENAMRPGATVPSYSGVRDAESTSDVFEVFNQSGFSAERIAVLSITGMMTKYARVNWDGETLEWIVPGMDDIAALIDYAMQSADIDGVVLVLNTPGGTTQSLIRIEEVLNKHTKPVVALVDGICASAGMYVASLCDKIYVMGKTCTVGSIGVMVQLLDDRTYYKKNGIKFIEVYPPESEEKNKAYRDAFDGDTQKLIEEVLTPLAKNFQEVVRAHRPIDESVKGVLSGRMFYADDAYKAGLIDQIGTFETAVHYIRSTASERVSIAQSMQ